MTTRPTEVSPPTPQSLPTALVILVDVDHTLLDGPSVRLELAAAIDGAFGPGSANDFWPHYEALRLETGYVDVPASLGRLADARGLEVHVADEVLAALSFADALVPGGLDALAHLAGLGTTVVLSDGDARFQGRKIESSGIAAAVGGRVMVVQGKAQAIEALRAQYPAAHYALLDDRPRVIREMKAVLGDQLTAILVGQGPYGDREAAYRGAEDRTLPSIAAAQALNATDLLAVR